MFWLVLAYWYYRQDNSLLVLSSIKSVKIFQKKECYSLTIDHTFLMYQKKANSLDNDDSCEDAHQNY